MTWDLRSNIKAQPGSQGTLLRGDQFELNQTRRWPKGYTPERQAEVREAVVGRLSQSQPLSNAVGRGFGPIRRNLIDNIARSTAPAEDFQGIRFAPGQRAGTRLPTAFSSYRAGEMQSAGNVGEYHPHGDVLDRRGAPVGEGRRHSPAPSDPTILVLRGHEKGDVPIHEIGHHVSSMRDTEHSGFYTERLQGQEEAAADEYAQEHFRDRRGRRTEVPEYHMGGRTAPFHDAYHRERGTGHHAPDFGQPPEDSGQGIFPGMAGQMGGKPGDPWYGTWF